jgi:hypothetical protein
VGLELDGLGLREVDVSVAIVRLTVVDCVVVVNGVCTASYEQIRTFLGETLRFIYQKSYYRDGLWLRSFLLGTDRDRHLLLLDLE